MAGTGQFPRRLVVALATTAAMTMPAGCDRSVDGTPSAPGGPTTIAVGNGPFLSNAGLPLSEGKGFFGEVGLKADIKVLTSGSSAIPQLLNNGLQFAAVDVATAIAAVSQRLPVQVVAPNTVGSPGEVGYAGIVVSPRSGITSPGGLVGKTVAVNQINGTAMILAQAAIAKAGVDWRAVRFTEVPPPQLLPTLLAGRSDAAALGEPEVTAAKSQNMTYLLNHHQNTVHANAHPADVRATAKSSTQVPATLLANVTLPIFGEKDVTPQEIDTWITLLLQYGGLDKSKAPSAAAVLGR